MKVAIGADPVGFPLKETIKNYLAGENHEVEDFGIGDSQEDTPYYVIANIVSKHLINKEFDRAILFCGTGMGIIANKHPGIYAAVCETPFAAEKSRSINNANVLTLGAFISTDMIAKEIVDIWLKTEFTEGWDASIQEWLRNSMDEISSLEDTQFAKK